MDLRQMARDVYKNEKAAGQIETTWLEFNRRCNIYTVFEETPEYFEWTIEDIRELDKLRKKGISTESLWHGGKKKKKGVPIEDLAYLLGRSTEEIALAIMDRELLGKRIRQDGEDLDLKEGRYYLFSSEPDFCHWHLKEVLLFDAAFKQKKTVQTLAEMFGRSQEEIALLIFDRALKNKI